MDCVEMSSITCGILGPLVFGWAPNHFILGAKMADLSTRFTGVEDLCILCCENLFITENTEWVSFIIIAKSFQDLISKVHNPRGLHECWK